MCTFCAIRVRNSHRHIVSMETHRYTIYCCPAYCYHEKYILTTQEDWLTGAHGPGSKSGFEDVNKECVTAGYKASSDSILLFIAESRQCGNFHQTICYITQSAPNSCSALTRLNSDLTIKALGIKKIQFPLHLFIMHPFWSLCISNFQLNRE